MKKIIANILIITILITFIMPQPSFATGDIGRTSIVREYNANESIVKGNGQVQVNGRNETPTVTYSGADAIISILATVSNAIAAVVRGLMSSFVNEGDITECNNFTIGELVSGEYDIFNNDFLLTSNDSTINKDIKEQVEGWYYSIRNLAIVISLLVLIYIGIRMAISTLSEDKAKYKKMLIAWLQSFILIFVLHYIMIIAFGIQKVLINIIPKVDGQAERTIANECWKMIFVANGWNIVWYAVLYWVMTYYQIKFFFLYAKRVVSTAFLIIIAPLITVTYSIDKVGDNKAQAFDAWMKEFLVNVFIQPVHLLVYLVFIVSASELATIVPLFTVIFFGALSRAEKIIKGLFGMRGRKSINSMGKHKK